MSKIKLVFIIPIAIVIICFLAWGGFHLQRQVNWSWSYESMVNQAIEKRIVPLELRVKQLESKLDNQQDN